jgi:hypothetical protein
VKLLDSRPTSERCIGSMHDAVGAWIRNFSDIYPLSVSLEAWIEAVKNQESMLRWPFSCRGNTWPRIILSSLIALAIAMSTQRGCCCDSSGREEARRDDAFLSETGRRWCTNSERKHTGRRPRRCCELPRNPTHHSAAQPVWSTAGPDSP